jgi:hypothetical protein
MMRGKLNLIASVVAFALGTIFVFSNSAGITANIIGASGSGIGFASIIGVIMIMGSILLFEVSQHNADIHGPDLERLIRRTNNHEELYDSKKAQEEPEVELHRSQHPQEHLKKN